MAQRLNGRVVVVTGGGSGIGRCVALDLAAEGAQVVVSDLGVWTQGKADGARAADRVVEEIKSSGGKAVANYEDVATMQGGENIIGTAVENFGTVDVLVCCAGIYSPKPYPQVNLIEETTEQDWDRMMAVHAKGHFSCIKPAVPLMKRQGRGRIVTISSGMAFKAGEAPAYSAAKAAILGLTRSLAIQLGRHGITVNAILPGAATPLFPGTGQKPPPEMVSPMAVYLASDEARDVNGQYLYIMGGGVTLYSHEKPMQSLHKTGKWTVDELVKLVPQLFGEDMVNPAPPK
ncbi:MAG: SDR family NAD(P)-dependent oxidoreductase [Chloroflexi bacterium]|nr:SDR family NAD(P)-dependent oxidoreductase [Chloroflexota bacterium]